MHCWRCSKTLKVLASADKPLRNLDPGVAPKRLTSYTSCLIRAIEIEMRTRRTKKTQETPKTTQFARGSLCMWWTSFCK